MLPPFQLDAGSDIPLYRQLFEQLRDSIHAGQVGRGERLPATRELAGSLGLNRATVAAAYELLENEGLLKGHVGRGTFVAGTAASESEPAAPVLAMREDGISFASSRPAVDLFPIGDFQRTAEEVVRGAEIGTILQLGSPAGYAPLRRYLMKEREGARAGDDILITSGCQQALDLIQRAMVRPGEAVVTEDPVYPGLRHVFASMGARVVGVPVSAEGIDCDALEGALRREKPRLVVVTPNFQNPTGATMPLTARLTLLRLAREAGAAVVENDIYGALRYRGERLPTLKQLDETGETIQIGSFSKVAFPGLRVGWVLGPRTPLARLTEAKQWCDLHSDQLSQAVLLKFAESGRLRAHVERVTAAGLERLTAALEACARHLPAGSRWTEPDGGMSLWIRLPEPLDAGELLPRAERAGANYLPGRVFTAARAGAHSLRLCFAGLPPERIDAGLAILGGVYQEELDRIKAARRMEPAPAMV